MVLPRESLHPLFQPSGLDIQRLVPLRGCFDINTGPNGHLYWGASVSFL